MIIGLNVLNQNFFLAQLSKMPIFICFFLVIPITIIILLDIFVVTSKYRLLPNLKKLTTASDNAQ